MNKVIILCFILALLLTVNSVPFCSSTCIDYTGACFDETPQGCWVCANHIFNFNSNLSSSTPCSLSQQSYIVASDLPNVNMTLTGYTSSQVTMKTCSNYTFSGQYTNTDFISKNYTNIPLNHYAVVVRFNVGYIGTWVETDYLRLNLQDSAQSIFYDYRYFCQLPQNICGEVGVNTSDCIRIRQYIMPHNTSYLFLNFTALTNQPNPSIQFWGIKEIIVAAKLCHSYCLTCYNQSNTNCLSCADGYYLQGNVCLPICQNGMYTIYDIKICAAQCPSGYYSSVNTTNNTKICLNCKTGCILCTDGGTCQAWSNVPAHIPNMWNDKLQFWIMLIIIGLTAIIFAIYKLIQWKFTVKSKELSERMIQKSDGKQNGKIQITRENEELIAHDNHQDHSFTPNQNVTDSLGPTAHLKGADNLWFNELVQMQAVEMKGKSRRKRNINPEVNTQQRSVNTINPTSRLSLDDP